LGADATGETGAATRRSRVFGWKDPAVSVAAIPHHSGLGFLREILAGCLPAPPIAATLGLTLGETEHGRAVFVLVPGEEHYNPIGGVYATLLDSAVGCAVQSVLPQGMGYTSIDLTLKFLRLITVDTGKVRAIGTVLNSGRRTALAQAELRDSGDRLLAHATSSCMLFPVPAR
jgi:uncharacterized protein (TIGR00369 family)